MNNENVAVRSVLWAIALVLSLVLVFQDQIATGFAVTTGDRLDGIIQISILEHWNNVYKGLSDWDTTNYFFPYDSTLAYNDGYFLFGFWHALFRGAGADPFLSAELVNFVFRIIGFSATFLLSRQILRLDFGWALLAAVLFTVSSGAFLQSGHAQILTVSLVPLFVWLAARMVSGLVTDSRAAALGWGTAAVVLYAAWLLTAFYTAWFLAFYTLLCLLALPFTGQVGRSIAYQGLALARRHALVLVLLLGVTAISLMPFLELYLPRAAETGMHDYSQVSPYLGAPFTLFNVGPDNLLYGGIVRTVNAHHPDIFHLRGEHVVGIPPVLLICFVIGAIWCWKHLSVLRAPIVAVVVFWILTLNIGGNSLWIWIYQAVPGAKATRAVVRSYIFLAGPVAVIAIIGLAGMFKMRGRVLLQVGLGLLLVVEQLNTGSVALLDRMEEKRRLADLPPPPAECLAFAAMVSREGKSPGQPDLLKQYSHNVDAMLIGEVFDLETINGVSTFNPPDWNFNDPTRFDYALRVKDYADKHDIEGLCGLDIAALQWDQEINSSIPMPSMPLAQPMEVGIGKQGSQALGSDWWPNESWGIWGRARATLWIMPPAPGNDTFLLTVLAQAFPHAPAPSQRVKVFADGALVATWDVLPTPSEFSAVLKRPKGQAIKVEFVAEDPISPSLLGTSLDSRVLGLGLLEYRLDPLSRDRLP